MYIGKRRNEMPPHLFAISDEAYRNMINGTNWLLSIYQLIPRFYFYKAKHFFIELYFIHCLVYWKGKINGSLSVINISV